MGEVASDEELILIILDGKSQVFGELVKRYYVSVNVIVSKYIANIEDCEEVVQDIFIRCYRSLAGFKFSSSFKTWLYSIAINASFSYNKRKKRVKTELLTAEHTEGNDSASEVIPVENSFFADLINKAIQYLKNEDAILVILFYMEGLNLEEISGILGLSTNVLKIRLFRARKKLKEILETRFRINKLNI